MTTYELEGLSLSEILSFLFWELNKYLHFAAKWIGNRVLVTLQSFDIKIEI